MKLFRWLLSHFFLILLIVVVIYGYMFWGNLAGDDTPAGKAIAYLSKEFVEVDEFVEAVKAKQAEISQESSEPVVQASATSVETASQQTAQQQPAQRPLNTNYRQNPMQGQPGQQPGQQLVQGNAAQSSPATMAAVSGAATGGKGAFVPPEIEKQLSNVDQQGRVVDSSQKNATVIGNWVQARKSFYQRNYELSEQSYQNVIDATEDNFDAYGELGNVYFNQGKNEQAASAYYEAAAILIRKGQVSRARSLMGLMRHLDKTKAEQLQKLIDSALS